VAQPTLNLVPAETAGVSSPPSAILKVTAEKKTLSLTMKVKVEVTLCAKINTDPDSTVELVIGPSETVSSLKERVAEAKLIPFPEQELHFDGKVLEDEARLSASGVGDGCSLNLKVKATEATLAQQFSELVKARNLSADELGLLYCYKHGATISQGLKCLGFEGNLEEFIGKQKTLSMNNGSVAIVCEDTSLKPFSVVDEIVRIVNDSPGIMDIRELSHKFADKFGASLSSILGCRPADFLSKNSTFVVHGHKRVSLHSPRNKQIESPPRSPSPESAADAAPDLSNDTPPGLVDDAPPGLANDTPPGLGNNTKVAPDSDGINSVDVRQYAELHSAIHSKQFNSEVTKNLNDLVAAISEMSFLDIDHVVTGGSIGKGTAIAGAAYADIVLFVGGLPASGHESWLQSLLKALSGILTGQAEELGINDISIVDQSLTMHMKNPPVIVRLFISPTFESYADTIQVLWQQEKDDLRFFSSALAKERTQFISRQPSSVKTTIRLMTWWRDQQQWSSDMTRPSDEILELATIYSSVQTKPSDQKMAIANVMSLLSRFSKLKVVWSNFYTKDDIPGHMLRQRPLLMDPANPFVNVADPKIFHARELMHHAQNTHFFW